MADKLPTIAGYLILGLIIVFLLVRNLWIDNPKRHHTSRDYKVAFVALLVAGIFLSFASPRLDLFAIGCTCASALACSLRWKSWPFKVSWPIATVLLLVFCIASTLAWWRRTGVVVNVAWGEWLALQVLLIASTSILLMESKVQRESRSAWRAAYAFFLLGAVFLVFSTGLYHQPWMLWLSWHHWGAYVGPAELASAGVRILHDVPLQYGLGPTVLLAQTCSGNCWLAMYFVSGASNLFYGALMILAASRICACRQSPLQIAIITLAVFLSVFVWTAYPPNVGSPALTPSISGLRFLPIALLIFTLIRSSDLRMGKPPYESIHLLWILCVLWSPESAFQGTAVWWPYYVWTNCSAASTNKDHRLRNFLHANVRLMGWLLAGCSAFLLVYWLAYRCMPTLDGYLAYVRYPPGELPINPSGAIWFFGLAAITGVMGLHRQLQTSPDSRQTHNVIITLLASYATASYFLGRSHDNNLLNISVFFLLLAIAIRELRQMVLLRVTACGLLATLLAYPMLMGWTSWANVEKAGNLVEFHPHRIVSDFSYTSRDGMLANQVTAGPHSSPTLGSDAAHGMRTISEKFHEPITVLDPPLNLEASSIGSPWSAFQGPENYAYLPSSLRRQFLANVAIKLNAPGWLLIRKDYNAAAWLSDYDAVYKRDRQLDFGTYYAIRYVPK